MAFLRMSIVQSKEFDKACIACQMAFGCIMTKEANEILIAAFNTEDGAVILDTLTEVGSAYKGEWF